MNNISSTLNCKNIINTRKLNNLPVYNFGLGENKNKTTMYIYRKCKKICR